MLRQAVRLNSLTEIALTKLDILDGFDEVKVCTGYRLDGEPIDYYPDISDVLGAVEPVYETLPGWKQSTAGVSELARLPAAGTPLAELAAATVHDAHALDPGRGLAALVLRAAESAGTPPGIANTSSVADPDEDERTRSRWARQGVAVNELAAPVLCLNLVADADTVCGRLLCIARAAGEPLHLSLRSLLRAPPRWLLSERVVFVCENPAVVAIAAQRLGSDCAPLVCTSGMPAAAQRTLLGQLAACGAVIRYHGDFDWPGLRIGNFVMRSFGGGPWRFGAQDYMAHPGRALEGPAVVAQWDAQLEPAMRSAGFALDEEAVIDTLMKDLAMHADP